MPKTSETTVSVRRAPRLLPFLLTFAIIGLIVSIALAVVIQATASFLGMLLVFGTALVTIAGWFIWGMVDAYFAGRPETVVATKIEG